MVSVRFAHSEFFFFACGFKGCVCLEGLGKSLDKIKFTAHHEAAGGRNRTVKRCQGQAGADSEGGAVSNRL